MTPPYLEWIASESEAFGLAITDASLGEHVPGCPDWDQRALVNHLGHVQRFWAATVHANGEMPDVGDEDPDNPPPLVGDASFVRAWFAESTSALLDALRAVSWDAPAWAWWKENRTVGAIARHQAGEAAIHRWDAQSVTGTQQPLPVELADDAVDEFMWLTRQLRDTARAVALRVTDTGNTYATGPAPAAIASATASDLLLLCYRRVDLDTVDIEGDRRVLDAFLEPVA
jgi:uncharacterized protein (TIGR03083 family)